MRKKVSKSAKDNPVVNVVWAEGLNNAELKALRDSADLALSDPDQVIITNYEIHWDRIRIDKNAVARMVWSDEISEKDLKKLRNQVDMALTDPDYVIVTNYPVHWVEISK